MNLIVILFVRGLELDRFEATEATLAADLCVRLAAEWTLFWGDTITITRKPD